MRRSMITAGTDAPSAGPNALRPFGPAALGLDVLAAVIGTLGDGIIVLNTDRRFIYANPAACELLGSSPDRLMGHDCLTFIRERERQTALTLLASARGAAAIVANRPDGSEREIEIRTTRLDVRGRQFVAVILRDVSERRRQWREATALAQAAVSIAVSDSIDGTVQALAEFALKGTRGLAAWVTVDDEDDVGAWVGTAGTPDGFAECVRKAATTRARCGPFMEALARQRVLVYADARRQVESEPGTACLAAALRPLPWQAGAFAPLVYQGGMVGILTTIYAEGKLPSEAETTFLAALADHGAIAAANARLVACAREKVALEERERLARELHDSISQALYGIELQARMARDRLDRDPDRVAQPIDHVLRLAEAGQAEMRALIFELRPGSLESEGLVATLNRQIEAIRARHGIRVPVIVHEEPEASIEAKEALYRIAHEALRNTARHAHARWADISLEVRAGKLVVQVVDDGVGFDPDREFPGHLGLRSMRERALAVGGSLEIVSSRGHGTRVVAQVPAVLPSPRRRRPGAFAQSSSVQRRIRSAV